MKYFVKAVKEWNKYRIPDGFTHVVGETLPDKDNSNVKRDWVFAYCFSEEQANRIQRALTVAEAVSPNYQVLDFGRRFGIGAEGVSQLPHTITHLVDFSEAETRVLREYAKELLRKEEVVKKALAWENKTEGNFR